MTQLKKRFTAMPFVRSGEDPTGPRRAGAGGAANPLRSASLLAGALLAGAGPAPGQAASRAPEGQGGTRIERSGRLDLDAIHPGAGDAGPALLVRGDALVLECVGTLRGASPAVAPETLEGVGIRITGRGVTLRGARVSGFRVGIHALEADGLVLEDCDVSDNFRQRLASTPEREAPEDWLSPHDNDDHEWVERYGAGIHLERCHGARVLHNRARRAQNGLVLERCAGCEVRANDFSFLSGWGIALWRSCDNRIQANACDFCVRGYSHGVYNRGQDSAGILLFEQCSRNVVAGNSATHCGDGFFCFAGQEALGAGPASAAERDHTRLGCNDNLVVANDFSYAAAHGLELTFGFGNRILGNRFVGNAICGIWGGYSRDTILRGNRFEANGDAGYGLERGGIDIEHGQRNRIEDNDFVRNRCGVHLWWDEDAGLAELPWTRANGGEVRENRVRFNRFRGDAVAVQLRQAPDTVLESNVYEEVGARLEGELDRPERQAGSALEALVPEGPADARLDPATGLGPWPLGARAPLAGREHIRLGPWGPLEPGEEGPR